MEIREIHEKKIWEEFITKHAPQSLFQSWNWGETVRKCQMFPTNVGIKCQMFWRLGLYDSDKLIGIAQVQLVKARRGTFLHIRHGPIFKLWRNDNFTYILDYLKQLSKSQNAAFIRISPLVENSQANIMFFRSFGFLDSPIHQMDGEYCWVLDLDKSDEQLFFSMRKTTRYLVRQAQKMGVKIVKKDDKTELNHFIALYEQTARRQHFVTHKGIKEEFANFLNDDQILLFEGYFHEKLLSGALILFYNHQAIYHHSASIDQKIPVNYLLQWEAIQEAKRRGKALYNFWGVAPEGNVRHPWQGLSLFKKGFGGRLVEYIHAKDLPLSPLYCATYMVEKVRKLWKGY